VPLEAADFERLFAPGERHSLSRGDVAAVRLRQDASLWLPSGRVVAGEPYGLGVADAPGGGFVQRVAPGRYPLVLVIAEFAERGTLHAYEMVAAARLVISDEPVVSWEMAVYDGQDVSELGDDEYFGYPVDGGTGGFVDPSSLVALDEEHDDSFDRLLVALDVREDDPTAPGTLTDDEGRPLVVGFSSGDGDGYYPTWVGRTADGDVACFLTDFFVLTGDRHTEDGGDDEPPSDDGPDDGPGYAPGDFAQGHEMRAGQVLRRQALTSPSGSHSLVHQDDGNLVLRDNGGRGVVWSTNTRGRVTAHCTLQADGDVVLHDEQGRAVWSTDTAGNPGSVLAVCDDGLELRDPEGAVLWSVRTAPGTPAGRRPTAVRSLDDT
jgi:hypothetical protein